MQWSYTGCLTAACSLKLMLVWSRLLQPVPHLPSVCVNGEPIRVGPLIVLLSEDWCIMVVNRSSRRRWRAVRRENLVPAGLSVLSDYARWTDDDAVKSVSRHAVWRRTQHCQSSQHDAAAGVADNDLPINVTTSCFFVSSCFLVIFLHEHSFYARPP